MTKDTHTLLLLLLFYFFNKILKKVLRAHILYNIHGKFFVSMGKTASDNIGLEESNPKRQFDTRHFALIIYRGQNGQLPLLCHHQKHYDHPILSTMFLSHQSPSHFSNLPEIKSRNR